MRVAFVPEIQLAEGPQQPKQPNGFIDMAARSRYDRA